MVVTTGIFITFCLSLLYFVFQFATYRKRCKTQDERANANTIQKLQPLPRISALSTIKLLLESVLRTGGVDVRYLYCRLRQLNKILEIHIWKFRVIFINDLKLGKELFRNPIFCGKSSTEMVMMFADGPYGLINSDGKRWKKNRQFVHQNLKEFGFGTKSMESYIHPEVNDIIENWARQSGRVFSPNKDFYLPVLNSIWVILTGDRASTQDKELVELVYSVYEGFRRICGFPDFLLAMAQIPLNDVKRIIKWIPIFPGVKLMLESVTALRKYLKNTVSTKNQALDLNATSTNLVDAYLQEISRTTDPESEFFRERGELNLLATMTEFFIAGGDTTANMIVWILLHLIRNPGMQERMRNEIDSVVDPSRYPSIQDRSNCPYTEAFILEAMRITPISTVSLPHSVTENTNIGQCFVEKGSIILFSMYGVQQDPDIWGDPETFRPERFLSEDGKAVVKNEALCLFSLGQRRCIGESMARDTLFLFISAICQRFVLKPDPSLKGQVPPIGVLRTALQLPDKFNMVAIDRFKSSPNRDNN